MNTKIWLGFGKGFLLCALPLFGAAGTLRWPAAWTFLVLLFGSGLGITYWLAQHDPALLQERMKPILQKDQPRWDRILLPFVVVIWIGWLVLMGLDARYGWSAMPAWLQWIGAAGVALAMWIWFLVFRENTFLLAPVVKIQKERGHKVISTGPYAIVRHPMYASALLLIAASTLLLGSWYGFAAAFAFATLLIMRTALEDRELERGLAGYTDYVARVQYRLVPLIW